MTKYGGGKQGGIEPSATSDNVFIYSDPSKAAKNGYNFDGWDPDSEVFVYTGDGPSGDQRLVGGNKSLYEHRQTETWRTDVTRMSAVFIDQPKAGLVITGVNAGNHTITNF
jgi:hypothetical protein